KILSTTTNCPYYVVHLCQVNLLQAANSGTEIIGSSAQALLTNAPMDGASFSFELLCSQSDEEADIISKCGFFRV
ncbi:hypothetical protein AVEN_43201-2-1, partial [Araneus ventricosus]